MIKYCESIFQTTRWKTRQVMVGNIGVGGNNPVRIQSMTTSNTRDIEATIEQVMRLADAGCEIARVTVQGIKEADACEHIKNGLVQKGYSIPLVADIHFYPPAALRVIDFVDKVRINPGNFFDKRASFKIIEYDDISYAQEVEKIEEKFVPLVEKCKRLKKSMRIGTNHGSLSDRIMNRYGDTPRGMLESALEFARICRQYNFHDFIFSMKSSNPQVMIYAYRLLVAEMITLGWDYPIHLGVTEAGEGEDGRIKSAMGIGALLLDGIGDTIRVSLTEDAWHEIDPCKRLVNFASTYTNYESHSFEEFHRHVENIQQRPIEMPKNVAMHRDGSVFVTAHPAEIEHPQFIQKIGYDVINETPKIKVSSVDGIVLIQKITDHDSQCVLNKLQSTGLGVLSNQPNPNALVIIPLIQAIKERLHQSKLARFSINLSSPLPFIIKVDHETVEEWASIEELRPVVIFLAPSIDRLHRCRHFFDWLKMKNLNIPVILNFTYSCPTEDLIIQAAAECGSLFCDGLGDGLWIEGPYEIEFIRKLSFNILQAARKRTSKTDFISCPSCGRTLFNLQDVSKRIRARTAHLPGVKIAIMGCIVNGPGEMADADFGYVGSKPGKIDLYVSKNCVEKDIDFADADDRLVELIKSYGRWVEPEMLAETVL